MCSIFCSCTSDNSSVILGVIGHCGGVGRYAHLKSHQKNVVSSLCEYFPSAVERVGMNLLGDSREAGLSASYCK